LNAAPAHQPFKPDRPAPALAEPSESQKLSEQIRKLEGEREDLLVRLTTEHPRVLDLDAELEELKSRLSDLPREPRRMAPVKEPALPGNDDEQGLMTTVRTLAAGRQSFRVALEQYETARANRHSAEATVEVLSQSQGRAVQPVPTLVAEYTLAEPAHVIQRVPAMPPLARLALLSLVSLLASVGTLMALRPRLKSRVWRNAAEVESVLGLPVLAQIGLR
jgi:hypothetical protein